ncbi:MAG: dihydrodipicolinate synthase family protein [Verrucomicrobiota bacterium]|nr:dihydrodipicolinate synthase family protein [Verrucomicrobiota bacterium]MDG1890917.1 dihydrodipicolinate synthase family protein [Verrucomicrobiota bacterium]
MKKDFFYGCIPALMTPCQGDGSPDHDELVRVAQDLIKKGMSAVVYCGSMGDWPLLTDAQRQEGVARLVKANIPVVVGTGAQNTRLAVEHASHAADMGAVGLMMIPRLLSRGTSPAAQEDHFAAILQAAPELPSVIYNSPYYGYETQAGLFFTLRSRYANLIGFKEFGGQGSLSYAAEHITGEDPDLALLVGVDTQVFHGFVHCGAVGAITGIGNVLPGEVLHFVALCKAAAAGDAQARKHATELNEALTVLSSFDEGPDLVLYYKHLMVLEGNSAFDRHFNHSDRLSASQKTYATAQLRQFKQWWKDWEGKSFQCIA